MLKTREICLVNPPAAVMPLEIENKPKGEFNSVEPSLPPQSLTLPQPPQTSQKRLNAILIRIPARLFVDIVKIILNFHENAEELE